VVGAFHRPASPRIPPGVRSGKRRPAGAGKPVAPVAGFFAFRYHVETSGGIREKAGRA